MCSTGRHLYLHAVLRGCIIQIVGRYYHDGLQTFAYQPASKVPGKPPHCSWPSPERKGSKHHLHWMHLPAEHERFFWKVLGASMVVGMFSAILLQRIRLATTVWHLRFLSSGLPKDATYTLHGPYTRLTILLLMILCACGLASTYSVSLHRLYFLYFLQTQ